MALRSPGARAWVGGFPIRFATRSPDWSSSESSLPLTLGLLVVGSWAILIDAPHVFATLARTWLDPEEWSERRSMLLRSTAWFLLGPGLDPRTLRSRRTGSAHALGRWPFLPTCSSFSFASGRTTTSFGSTGASWFSTSGETTISTDPVENRVDAWFFNAALYLPLLLFMTAPWYRRDGECRISVSRRPLAERLLRGCGSSSSAPRRSTPRRFSPTSSFRSSGTGKDGLETARSSLLLLAVAPLHLAVFSHPLLALFVVPVVTVGHNLQYHRIVWVFGRNKY